MGLIKYFHVSICSFRTSVFLKGHWTHLLLDLSIGSLHNNLLSCGGSGVLLHAFSDLFSDLLRQRNTPCVKSLLIFLFTVYGSYSFTSNQAALRFTPLSMFNNMIPLFLDIFNEFLTGYFSLHFDFKIFKQTSRVIGLFLPSIDQYKKTEYYIQYFTERRANKAS